MNCLIVQLQKQVYASEYVSAKRTCAPELQMGVRSAEPMRNHSFSSSGKNLKMPRRSFRRVMVFLDASSILRQGLKAACGF